MTAKEHNKLVGVFLLIHGGLYSLIMALMCIIYVIMGGAMFATARGEERFIGLVFILMVVFVVLMAVVFTLPQVLGGYKMFKEKPNARTWGIIGSIIACVSFPFGTAAGVYGLWFLFGDIGKQFYLAERPNASFMPPPPPNSWQ